MTSKGILNVVIKNYLIRLQNDLKSLHDFKCGDKIQIYNDLKLFDACQDVIDYEGDRIAYLSEMSNKDFKIFEEVSEKIRRGDIYVKSPYLPYSALFNFINEYTSKLQSRPKAITK